MGDYRVLAAVTATLADRVRKALAAKTNAEVTTQRPGQNDGERTARVNIFLFHVNPNPYTRNNDVPTRFPDGSLVQRPRQALDLHYLLSFYGSETENALEPQILMGLTLNSLYAEPILHPAAVAAMAQRLAGEAAGDGAAGTDPAVWGESIALVPLPMELEALARLWSTAFQAPYALSVAMRASAALLVDDGRGPDVALPVLERRFVTSGVPLPHLIEAWAPDRTDGAILFGGRLEVSGSNLGADIGLRVGAATLAPLGRATTSRVAVALVDPALRAGVQAVSAWRGMAGSNRLSVILRPLVESVTALDVQPVQADAPSVQGPSQGQEPSQEPSLSGTLSVSVRPAVGGGQEVALLLNELEPPAGLAAFSTHLPATLSASGPEGSTLTADFTGVPAGTYLVRARVDGADSVPGRDPATKRFNAPLVALRADAGGPS